MLSPIAIPKLDWHQGNRAWDLTVSKGQPIYAPVNGRVVFAGQVATDSAVSISVYGPWRTTLTGLQAIVQLNQEVRRGDLVGFATGNVLSWGLKKSAHVYQDPWSQLKFTTRLVP
ncbi:hypothetical protein BK816_03920 [Boudabousia tangfeifanii]|uniref:M23ase beta-sheet core domain-containing protein n=1 Tax=Boudabousia tangfeifanii TaxID=1912795 RepID=A0A1D9MK39_9ACTO|nr:hypothetical protein BK816_03920 [Boudabousia tangfeifanii]